MKINIVYLLLITLSVIIVSELIAQQNQNVPKTDTEVEKLKIQLQTLENEKIGLETKLAEANAKHAEANAKHAEANAKLINTEFGKLKLELKDSNQQWLRNWIFIILGILSVVGFALWKWLTTKMDGLIENEVNKRLTDFEGAIEKVKILEPQVRILNKEHAASVLERFRPYRPEHYPEQVKELEEQALLDAFNDETRHLQSRIKAAEVLANGESTKLVSSVLKCLNSYIDSDFDWDQGYTTQHLLCNLIYFIGQVRTTETYETLNRFLEQLLSEKPEVKRFIIASITFSLVYANNKINKNDSLPVIRNAIPILDLHPDGEDALNNLVMLFEKYQEYEGIKEILTNGLTERLPNVEKRCLELLPEQYSDFVKDWKDKKEDTNTESEESDESEPTE